MFAWLDAGLNLPYVKEFIAAIVAVAGFAYTCYRCGRRIGSEADRAEIEHLKSEIEVLDGTRASLGARLFELERVVKDPKDFWLRSPSPEQIAEQQAALNSSVPIICVVNFKGGVGKTTICANLGAYFAERGKRVLLIDCDYQGSLSDTVMTHAGIVDYRGSAYMLIEGENNPEVTRAAAERVSSIDSRMWIYPAFYDFSRSEVKMMFRWLVGQDSEIRYNLSQYLQSPPFKTEAETGFDIVLIDAPPRLLTGVVNSLVASTHVLIPTILDGQSHLATINTVMAIQQFKQKLNPGLKLLGVVPSMVATASGYNDREAHFISELERQLGEIGEGPVPILKSRPVWRREELAKAGGSEIIYRRDSNSAATRGIREMFATLGEYVEQNVRWRQTVEPDFAVPGRPKIRVAQ